MSFTIKPKKKPRWIREKIAWLLVRLARKIYPKSEAVNAFFYEQIMRSMITGTNMVKCGWKEDEVYKNWPDKEVSHA